MGKQLAAWRHEVHMAFYFPKTERIWLFGEVGRKETTLREETW